MALLDRAIEILRSRQDDEALHTARKNCKRIRAGLRLLREVIGEQGYQLANSRVRDAAKPLTAVRDAFVLRKTLRSLPERPARLRRRLDAEYHGERQALQRHGLRSELARLTTTREKLLAVPNIGSEASSAIAGVRRIFKAGHKAWSKARDQDDKALHEWRKQAKYFLNQLELLQAVFNAKFNKIHRRADQLAEALGDDHDLAVLLAKVHRYEIDSPALVGHIKKRRHRLQAQAFRFGKKLYRRSAKQMEKAVATRLGRH